MTILVEAVSMTLTLCADEIIPVYIVCCTHSELWFELCFYLMYVFESTTACCEVGVKDVVMTTVANDLQVTTA